jgi:hypothetical protein
MLILLLANENQVTAPQDQNENSSWIIVDNELFIHDSIFHSYINIH